MAVLVVDAVDPAGRADGIEIGCLRLFGGFGPDQHHTEDLMLALPDRLSVEDQLSASIISGTAWPGKKGREATGKMGMRVGRTSLARASVISEPSSICVSPESSPKSSPESASAISLSSVRQYPNRTGQFQGKSGDLQAAFAKRA